MGKRLRRIDICMQLKLGNRQSYRIVPPSYGPLNNSDEVLHIINQARRGIQEPLDSPPLDMMTAEEISKIAETDAKTLFSEVGISRDALSGAVKSVYSKVVESKLPALLSSLDIKKIVEEKVNAMDTLELENLVLSVMKNELNAVVNLGAVIGLVIGVLNVIINI